MTVCRVAKIHKILLFDQQSRDLADCSLCGGLSRRRGAEGLRGTSGVEIVWRDRDIREQATVPSIVGRSPLDAPIPSLYLPSMLPLASASGPFMGNL